MAQPQLLSADQQALISLAKPPANWALPNPSMNPSPFNYYNSYVPPATPQSYGSLGVFQDRIQLSNKFNSALTQPFGPYNQFGGAQKGIRVNPLNHTKPMYSTMPLAQKGAGSYDLFGYTGPIPAINRSDQIKPNSNQFNSAITQKF